MPDTGEQAVYFEPFVKGHNFKYNDKASFDDNFARLAKKMKWQRGSRAYAKHLASATPYVPQLNTLVAYNELGPKEFVYTPRLKFDVEFGRLAASAGVTRDTEEYKKHQAAAKLLHEKIRSHEVTQLKFFRQYVDAQQSCFQLNPSSTIDANFQALANIREWGEPRRSALWNELMQEARRLVDKATQQKTSSHVAPSETSGVRLPSPLVAGEHSAIDTPAGSVSAYFSSFASSDYTPDPSIGFREEFDRLSLHEGWTPRERVKQWCLATEGELEASFGKADKLSSWQALCVELGIDPPPSSITKCKKAVKTKHVSIKELVESRRELMRQRQLEIPNISIPLPGLVTISTMAQMGAVTKSTVKVFFRVKALSKHCKKEKKFFPKITAKEDGFLKALLRQLTF